jgi:hypothetical protein
MCLHVISAPLIAEKNIKAKKVLRKYDNVYYSPYKSMDYRINELPPLVNIIPEYEYPGSSLIINRGYHMYTNNVISKRGPANQLLLYCDNYRFDGFAQQYELVDIIIPKGTKYFKGSDNDLVAEQFMFPEPLGFWKSLLNKLFNI